MGCKIQPFELTVTAGCMSLFKAVPETFDAPGQDVSNGWGALHIRSDGGNTSLHKHCREPNTHLFFSIASLFVC